MGGAAVAEAGDFMVGDSVEVEDSTVADHSTVVEDSMVVRSMEALLLLEHLCLGDIKVDFMGVMSHLEVFQHLEHIMVGIMEDPMAVM